MQNWLARLRYALRRHGPVGFIQLAGYNFVYCILRHNRKAGGPAPANLFDEKYGTDTSGVREIGSLDVVNAPAARYAVRYDPSSPDLVRAQLAKLPIDYRHYIFIDFGSGKGRVLLVAAEFAFKEVIGIEFSRELHNVAVRNIGCFPARERQAGKICSIHRDVGSYELPRSDLVCYFYNPFGPPVIQEVAARLAALHALHGYQVIVIYVDPRHLDAFEKTGAFVVIDSASDALILTTDPGAANSSTSSH